jgi:hypothetical protein
VVTERRLPNCELVDQYAQPVVVELVGITLFGGLQQDLWRHCMDRPTNRVCPFLVNLLCESKVDHLHPAILIQHEIARLDIPVHNPRIMHFLEYPGYLRDDHLSHFLVEGA